MGYCNYKGVAISATEAALEQYHGRPVLDSVTLLPVRVDLYSLEPHPYVQSQVGTGGAGLPTPVTVITNTSQLPASPADGDMAVIRVGTWPDTAQVELMYSAAGSALAGRAVWVQIGFYQCIMMSDQGYMGLPNNGGANDNGSLGLVYVAAGSFNALNAGAPNQTGFTVSAIEYADALFTAGLKLQARMQGFFAGNGTAAMFTIPLWFAANHGDAASATTLSPREAPPSTGAVPAIQVAAMESAGRCAITSPTAAIAGGVQFMSTGWVDMTELTSVTVTKRYLYPRLFAKMVGGAVAATTPAGALDGVHVGARWTT